MIHGQWKTDKKRVSKLKTEGGFRLIRVFSIEHNADRLRVYARRLSKRLAIQPDQRKFRLVLKRSRRNKNAPYQAQQPGTGRGDGNHHAASIAAS
ncbi:MAG: hypothetical protein EPO09_19545 [Aquabacterium sp.]|uniref:hypothetical protein n=1 Tax=Aquabacterium sp. TaxID=1872578 RepID=UPI00121814D2|nr:hypothetical protein [Aquabacterium sp.]TAK86604.1 MAG: hypothetical protein EPO09_19545 [Aquabacterium sp.]